MQLTRVAVMLAIVLAGCGAQGSGTEPSGTGTTAPPREDGRTTRTPGASDLSSPPPVTVRSAESTVTVPAYTYCFGTVCADGVPPADPPDVGNPDQVIVEFPLPDWSFTATFERVGVECPRRQDVALAPNADGAHTLTPVGTAGTYDVTLFGRGGGDLFVTFRWTTPVDGPLPEPEARVAVLADNDGRVDSHGVELRLRNLARTPDEATAEITVRADDGASTAFQPTRAAGQCWPEGTVHWDGPDEAGQTAAALGDGPFTYEVDLLLDGRRHTATATWPDDLIEGNEPSVALQFDPPLPSLSR